MNFLLQIFAVYCKRQMLLKNQWNEYWQSKRTEKKIYSNLLFSELHCCQTFSLNPVTPCQLFEKRKEKKKFIPKRDIFTHCCGLTYKFFLTYLFYFILFSAFYTSFVGNFFFHTLFLIYNIPSLQFTSPWFSNSILIVMSFHQWQKQVIHDI